MTAPLSAGDERLRLFYGVALDPDTLPSLMAWRRPLEAQLPGARWIAPADLHVTLRFLGATAASDLPALRRLQDAVAASHRRSRLTYPRLRRWGQLLVIEFSAEPALLALADALEHAVRRLGFAAETRPFRPHVTLARRVPRLDHTVPAPGRHHEPPPTDPPLEPSIDHVALFRSLPPPGPLRYSILARAALPAADASPAR